MNIGNKIKVLRKEKGVTQEELANSVGVSFQAVSKWENNIALPDITLLPLLAEYFRVSMDELFDFSLREAEAEIMKIVHEAAEFRESDPTKSRRILEDGMKNHPGNEILLNNLLYVLNYKENPDETIRIASSLTEKAEDVVKYDALRFLAYAYKAKGDLKSAEAAIEQIPEIYFTKLTEIAYLLEGKPKYDAAEKQKWISFENLLQMIWKEAEYYESNGDVDKAVSETERALKLIPIMDNKNFDTYIDFFTKQLDRMKKEDS